MYKQCNQRYLDLLEGSPKYRNRHYVSSLVLTVFTVLEVKIRKQRMLFPKIFISVQETKESDVRSLQLTNDMLSHEQGVRIYLF